MKNLRGLVVANGKVVARREKRNGKDYLVVPVIALVEGAIRAMNADDYEFVGAEEFTRAPSGWNGRPLFHGHPVVNGSPVSGNSPALLESASFGEVFNTEINKDGKLAMEAWLEIERTGRIAPRLLARVMAGEPIEISVGTFVDTDKTKVGIHNGRRYSGAWKGLVPDHLALLPEDQVGACSRDMGCGVRYAIGNGNNQYVHDNPTARQHEDSTGFHVVDNRGGKISSHKTVGEARSHAQAQANDGKGRTAVVHTESDTEMSEHFADVVGYLNPGPKGKFSEGDRIKIDHPGHALHGKTGKVRESSPSGNFHNVHRGGKHVGYFHESNLKLAPREPAYKVPSRKKRFSGLSGGAMGNVLARVLAALRGTSKPAGETLEAKIYAALQAKDAGALFPDVIDEEDGLLVYSTGDKSFSRDFAVAEDGTVTVADEVNEVEPILTYQPVTVEEGDEKKPKAAAAKKEHDCSCHKKPAAPAAASEEKKTMEKTARIKALIGKLKGFTEADVPMFEAATEEQLVRFETLAAQPEPKVEPKAEPKVAAETKVEPKAEPKVLTADEYINAAPAELQASLRAGVKMSSDRKAATIASLKASGRCTFTDEALAGKSQDELNQLVALADIKPATDFSGAGAPKDTSKDATAIPAAPDLATAIKAARGGK